MKSTGNPLLIKQRRKWHTNILTMCLICLRNIGVDTPRKFGYTVTSPKFLVYKYLLVAKLGNELLQSKVFIISLGCAIICKTGQVESLSICG